MAKDDMEVIAYKILRYLYDCLKAGKTPREEDFGCSCRMFDIPHSYWTQIMMELAKHGFVKGVMIMKTKDGVIFADLQDTMITPRGIEYLFENSLMEKVKRTLKDVKEITPFI